MRVNSRFTVAIHILVLLALEKRPLTSKYIAGSVNTNPVVVRRILGTLSKASLVTTQLGAEGGTSLAHAPETLTLREVYRVIEQGDLFTLHHNPPNSSCLCGRNIQPVLTRVLKKAEAALESALAASTIADLAKDIRIRSHESDQA